LKDIRCDESWQWDEEGGYFFDRGNPTIRADKDGNVYGGGIQIEDGVGSGRTAKVDDENKLDVKATRHSEEHQISARDGQTFVVNTADTADTLTLATGNTYNMVYLLNDSSEKILVLGEINVTTDTDSCVFILTKNPTLGTVSANNVHTPINANFSSGRQADATCHTWDETGTVGVGGLSGGTKVTTCILRAGIMVISTEGSMLLGKGDSVSLRLTNGTGGNVEAAISLRFYFDELLG
jgi:hypothetical protein